MVLDLNVDTGIWNERGAPKMSTILIDQINECLPLLLDQPLIHVQRGIARATGDTSSSLFKGPKIPVAIREDWHFFDPNLFGPLPEWLSNAAHL